jgi:hypothetical protein
MAKYQPKKMTVSDINVGQKYQNGQAPQVDDFNKVVEGVAYATEKAEQANSNGGGTKLFRHFLKSSLQGATLTFLSRQDTAFTIADIIAFYEVYFDGTNTSGNATGRHLIEMSTMMYNDSIIYGSEWGKVTTIGSTQVITNTGYSTVSHFDNAVDVVEEYDE